MSVTLHISGKWQITLVATLAILLSSLLVHAFGSNQPSVFGHSSDEIQFNITYTDPPKVCGMASYETISGTNGTTFCSLVAFDDDSTAAFTSPECDIRRRDDGLWEYRFNVGCGQTNCVAKCFTIQ